LFLFTFSFFPSFSLTLVYKTYARFLASTPLTCHRHSTEDEEEEDEDEDVAMLAMASLLEVESRPAQQTCHQP
jgi:hypothetical protein